MFRVLDLLGFWGLRVSVSSDVPLVVLRGFGICSLRFLYLSPTFWVLCCRWFAVSILILGGLGVCAGYCCRFGWFGF